jgi:hypothetical protein
MEEKVIVLKQGWHQQFGEKTNRHKKRAICNKAK